jgi:hypothetical protein
MQMAVGITDRPRLEAHWLIALLVQLEAFELGANWPLAKSIASPILHILEMSRGDSETAGQ